MKKQKNVELPEKLACEFEQRCLRLGLKQKEAMEKALSDWLKATSTQVPLPTYFPHETKVTIVQPETVNIAIFQKAELVVAREQLQRLLGILERTQDLQFKHETRVQLAQTLKRIEPIYRQTRDPELEALIKKVEETL